jgi:N-acetylglucosaminyl-diphospho-decaprenol L-rhamnosyltransferase
MSNAGTPLVDAVIVSYNSSDTLRDCVEPLAAMPRVAVTVVDNDSTDGALETIADLPVARIDSGRNGGFSFGCNVGLAAGSAPYVLFLNPDARMETPALDAMLAALEADPGTGLVGPRLLDEDGSLMPSRRRFPRVASTWAQALFLHRLIPRARWVDELDRRWDDYLERGEPEWVSGACMLARRDVLERIGGLDEGFFLYCEDTDVCARIRAAGYTIRYEPAAIVHHAGGQSAPRHSLLPVLAESRSRYARKHASPASAALQVAGLAAHAATHALATVRRPGYARGHLAALRRLLRRGTTDVQTPPNGQVLHLANSPVGPGNGEFRP